MKYNKYLLSIFTLIIFMELLTCSVGQNNIDENLLLQTINKDEIEIEINKEIEVMKETESKEEIIGENLEVLEETTISPIISEELVKTEEVKTDVVFSKVDEILYATDELNVRSGPGIEYDIVNVCVKGQEIHRIGIGENNWSRILLNNEECYVSSKYLSTIKYELVYALNDVYIRAGASTKYDVVGTLLQGESVYFISSENGWSKVIYNNQECYIGSRHLSKTQIETIYALTDVNIRAGTGTNYDIINVLKNGQEAKRIGIDGDWSKIIFNGQEGYVKTKYIAVG